MAHSPHARRGLEPVVVELDRLTVGVVGAGRVGSVLGAALTLAGHRVTAASAVSSASRARAEALLPGVPLLPADEVAARCSLLLLAVPDDVLPGLVAGLADTGALRRGQLVLHVSGRHGTAVLAPATAVGARPLALHPAMTFTGTAADLPRLAGAAYGVTTPPQLRALAGGLVRSLGGEPVDVPEQLRPLWHAGLAHGANHLVTLVASAMEVLRATGVEDPAAVLRPLLATALDNALTAGDAALTGPVARGDAGTVTAHLAALAEHAPTERATYLTMARATAGRLPAPPAGALLDALGVGRARRRARS